MFGQLGAQICWVCFLVQLPAANYVLDEDNEYIRSVTQSTSEVQVEIVEQLTLEAKQNNIDVLTHYIHPLL